MGAKTLLNETIAAIEQSVSAQSNFSKVCSYDNNYLLSTVSASMQALLVDLRTSLGSLQSQTVYLSHGEKFMCSK